MSIHIFWDNSNVWGGLSQLRLANEPTVPWFALRVYFKNIYELVSKGRLAETKIMAGSVPPECEELWDCARILGFQTDLLKRVDSSQDVKCEQAVDEILHMKMANAILDYEGDQTMILLSGDSSLSTYDTSFPSQLQRALKKGWKVEVYSASSCISKQKYKKLIDEYPRQIELIDIDPYYFSLTYVREGEYYHKDSQGNRTYFHVNARIVSALRV
ncbi:MAG: NYN domain-containing protein [Rectinema sp.]